VGPATGGEGHALTQPVVNVSIRCPVPINGITITLPDHMPIGCSDSAGHDCTIQGHTALFPFSVPPFESRTFGVTADPPLQHGDLM